MPLMPEPISVYVCPGCGRSVDPDHEYVLAQEYELARGFSSRKTTITKDDLAVGAKRRFHAGHFRGQIGGYYYELIDDES